MEKKPTSTAPFKKRFVKDEDKKKKNLTPPEVSSDSSDSSSELSMSHEAELSKA
jgi:hypothetical protein